MYESMMQFSENAILHGARSECRAKRGIRTWLRAKQCNKKEEFILSVCSAENLNLWVCRNWNPSSKCGNYSAATHEGLLQMGRRGSNQLMRSLTRNIRIREPIWPMNSIRVSGDRTRGEAVRIDYHSHCRALLGGKLLMLWQEPPSGGSNRI